jgi:hypothetical protein
LQYFCYFLAVQGHAGIETQFDIPAFGNKPPQFGGQNAQPIVGY